KAARISTGSANVAGAMEHGDPGPGGERHGECCRAHQQLASARGPSALLGAGQHAGADSRFRIAHSAPSVDHLVRIFWRLGADTGCGWSFWSDIVLRRR